MSERKEAEAAELELLVNEVMREAEHRLAEERLRRRTVELAREQAYLRLALEIDRPKRRSPGKGQLSFFPDLTLFDED